LPPEDGKGFPETPSLFWDGRGPLFLDVMFDADIGEYLWHVRTQLLYGVKVIIIFAREM
jgi:hypothetical protein